MTLKAYSDMFSEFCKYICIYYFVCHRMFTTENFDISASSSNSLDSVSEPIFPDGFTSWPVVPLGARGNVVG